ncbi:hypothetical protein TELCIR_12135 [Teladorsagia circumcincta]|uniref:BEACH domain-containing protein n=1 Tax=Teladorsagia circumcincta TaxID=45464 RepID=A0A2G9U7B8_TELCI|nr:hypothetical protein TELCIR_12135 [Teladorsagia circumcincta]
MFARETKHELKISTYLLSNSLSISKASANRAALLFFGRFALGFVADVADADDVLGLSASSYKFLVLVASLFSLRLAFDGLDGAGVAADAGMNWFERTRSGRRDSLIKYSLKKKSGRATKVQYIEAYLNLIEAFDSANEDAADYWKDIACKFGTCYGRISEEEVIEAEYRPFRVIPHIVPTIAIVVKDGTAVAVISELGPDWVDLNTVLRHSYSNIEQYSQVHNFVVTSLADVYFQLNLLKFYVTEPHFYCDNVFWLLCDPFATSIDECPYEDFAYRSKATSQWVNGTLSNYDYILELNKAAGRVRGEIHNHPILPWVCDFKEQNGGWRDLSKTKYRLTKGDDQLG